MRRSISLLTLFLTFHVASLPAQETLSAPADEAEEAQIEEPFANGAAPSAPTKPTEWQNWIFAGSALLTAAIGVLVVSLDNGSGVNSH